MLKTQKPHSRNGPYLIDQLREDIRRKGLRVGDRYLTASEAARSFGVSATTINRAMNALAEKDVLIRHRSRGTFVGPKMEEYDLAKLRTVYLLIPSEGYDSSDFPFSSMICGIRQAMGNVNVQQCFIPRHDGLPYVRELLRSAKDVGEIGGFVAASCPRAVYALLAESAIPTVVFGTLYPDQKEIPSIDVDQLEAGRLVIERLVQLGHRCILLLTSVSGKPGDHHFLDGVSMALTAARLPHNSLIVRIVVHDELDVMLPIVHDVLNNPEHPTAVIVRGHAWLDKAAEEAFASITGSLLDRIEVVHVLDPLATDLGMAHTIVKAKKNSEEIFKLVGEMLQRIGEGQSLEEQRFVIPVSLRDVGKETASAIEPADKTDQ